MAGEASLFVYQLVYRSIQQHSPIPGSGFCSRRRGVHPHVGCAVTGQSAVELWSRVESVNCFEIIDEQPPRSVRFNAGPIKVELLVTVIRSDANQISFIGDDVSQLELF